MKYFIIYIYYQVLIFQEVLIFWKDYFFSKNYYEIFYFNLFKTCMHNRKINAALGYAFRFVSLER